MNARMMRWTALLAALPFTGVVLILVLQNNPVMMTLTMLMTMLLQIPMMALCKRAVRPFIRPNADVLAELGVSYVPAAYEPGRCHKDARVSEMLIASGLAAPVLARLAVAYQTEVTVTVLNFLTYTAPSLTLLVPAFLTILLSAMAFLFWFEAARAAAVYGEGSERRRYLMMGFVDRLETKGADRADLAALRNADYEPAGFKPAPLES